MNIQYGSRPVQYPDNVFLIGDIHNEADKLQDLLDQVLPLLSENDHLVFLGDLVDRGPKAAKTIEILVDLARRYPKQVFFVRGNHDWMLQHYLATGSTGWLSYLGITLENFKDEWGLPNTHQDTITKALIDKGFREITSRMVPYYETDEIISTHAPIDRTTVLMNGGDYYEEQYEDRVNNPGFTYLLDKMDHELLWQFIDENEKVPEIKKFLVCGHQPGHYKNPRIRADRAFIDTGCGKGNRPVTCLKYPGKKYWQSR